MGSHKDKSNWYAAAVGVVGIAFMLFLSGTVMGQGLSASLIGSGTTPGQVGTKYYEQTTITTNYHMGNDPSLQWRWVEQFNAGSSMVGKTINEISLPLKTTGAPAGIVNVAVWSAASLKVYDFATINANQITPTTMWYTFRGEGTYTIAAGDRIGIGFHAGNIANYLTAFGANTNPFESSLSLRQRYNGTHWVSSVSEDLTAVIGFTNPTSGGGDTLYPSLAITSPTQGATVTAPFTVTGIASDNVGVVSVEVKTEWINPANPTDFVKPPYQLATPRAPGDWSTWSITLNPQKAAVVMATAKDAAGNQQWSVGVNINMITSGPPGDTTPPTISISSPASSSSIASTSIGVTGTAADNVRVSTVTWSMDGSAFSPVAMTPGTSLGWAFTALDVAVGTHTITVRAVDSAGLSANAQVIFTVTSSNPIPDPTCQPGYTYDPVNKVCTGNNPPLPTCPTGFTYDAVAKVCVQNDLPNPNLFSGNNLVMMAVGVGTVAAVIATKAKYRKTSR